METKEHSTTSKEPQSEMLSVVLELTIQHHQV